MYRGWRVGWFLIWALMLAVLVVDSILAFAARQGWRVGGEMLALALSAALGVVVYREMRHEMDQRQVLLKVGADISSRLELGDLLGCIVEAIMRLVPAATKCVIHLLDESGRRLYPIYTSQPNYEQSLGMPANRGIAGQALQELRTKVVDDVRQEPGFLPLKSRSDLRSLMVAPLHSQGKPLGTISLNSRFPGAFSEREQMLVTTLAAEASAAINQTRLYDIVLRGTRQIEAIMNNLGDGLVVLDAEGRVLRYNPPLAHLLGVDVADIVGYKVEALGESEGVRRLARILGDRPADPHQSYERQVEIDDPVHAILRVHVSPVLEEEGGWGCIVMIHDETDELDQIRAKSGFLAAAAQELRAPLESIHGYATLLTSRESPQDTDDAQWAKEIRAHSAHLMRLAEDLADLCAADAGEMRISIEPVAFDALVSEVLADFGQTVGEKGLSVQKQFDPNLPALPLDEDRLRHVLYNLLEDAVCRARPGGRIALKLEANLEELTFGITDDGRPLPPGAQARILGRPQQAESVTLQESTSTGLGLYLSRRIIEAHGGHLWIEGAAEHETRLQFILPLSSPQQNASPRS